MEWPKKDNHKEEHNRLHVETTTWHPKDRKLLAKNTQPQEKAYRKECQNLETLNHILFECQVEGREEIWDMAEKLWNRTTKDTEKNQWTAPSEQMIRGFGGIKKTKRTPSTALMQKYIKIVLETAWLDRKSVV